MLIKLPTGDGRYRYAFPLEKNVVFSQSRMVRMFQDSVTSIDYSENIIVIKTLPGAADELVQKIQSENWFDYDVVVATPDMMGVVGRIGRVLGPKGLMPNPKSGTVTFDVAKAIEEIKAGKVEYRVDKTAIVHCPIGKKSFGTEKLKENFKALMDALVKAKPSAAKGQYLKSVSVSSTMGPSAKINPTKALD